MGGRLGLMITTPTAILAMGALHARKVLSRKVKARTLVSHARLDVPNQVPLPLRAQSVKRGEHRRLALLVAARALLERSQTQVKHHGRA